MGLRLGYRASAASRARTIALLSFFGVPALLTWRYARLAGELSFTETLSHLYAVWMVVNLWDLVAIDWPYAYLVDVNRPPIPGTAGAAGYKDYGFHFRGFLKASVFGLLVIVPAALAIWLAR